MAAPLSNSLLGSVICEYDPKGSEDDTNDPVQSLATQALQRNRGPDEAHSPPLSRTVSPVPDDIVLKSFLSESNAADLSQSLMTLRKKGLSSERIAESLMGHMEIRNRFKDKEELVKILRGLQFLLEDLVPEEPSSSNEIEPIGSGWVYVSQKSLHASNSKHPYFWSAISGAWNVAKQISEVKGVASSLMTLYFLRNDPRAVALGKGLIWLVGFL